MSPIYRNKVNDMMTPQDIQALNLVTDLLASGLAQGPETVSGVPLEVSQALTEAREQMSSLPEVIENLNLSFERFNTISAAITRMIRLADQASCADLDEPARGELNEEFAALAHILAADAGRRYYAGPRLNLLNEGEAKSAAKIIRYMTPVIENMGQELAEQKNIIHEVISETINFLGVITQCYPESEGVESLSKLIAEARKHCRPEQEISIPAGRLH